MYAELTSLGASVNGFSSSYVTTSPAAHFLEVYRWSWDCSLSGWSDANARTWRIGALWVPTQANGRPTRLAALRAGMTWAAADLSARADRSIEVKVG